MRQVFLDTETTGLSHENGDRIIEIGCVEMFNRRLTGNNLHFYINPERDSHEDAIRIHGITNEFLQDKPKFAQLSDAICSYLQDAEIIIHNAPFDVGCLNAEFKRLDLSPLEKIASNIIDTLSMAKEIYPGKRNSLDALCTRLEVDNSGRTLHGALLDAELLADVYINLTRGQDALLMDEAPTASGQKGHKTFDFSTFQLPIIQATESENLAHTKVLEEIMKSAKKVVWPS